jgi:hypothetical protein
MKTAVANRALLTLQPTGVASSTSLNPVFTACDPLNGNYFVATGRDLLTFYSLPTASAPAWSAGVGYTAGQVVLAPIVSPPSTGAFIALSTNLNQDPATSPTFWATYTGSTLTLYSAPDACTGRKSDVTNYPVPDITIAPSSTIPGGVIQFQVLPSSVFTQTDGSIQFLASSSLVQVSVSSL